MTQRSGAALVVFQVTSFYIPKVRKRKVNMRDKQMSIELFNQLINAESDGQNRLLDALRSLRAVNETSRLVEDPSPLGYWPGWRI
jgi:hypothetical protein